MFFHALTFAGSRDEAVRPRDPTSVNAMKQTCVIVILYILPDFNLNRTEHVAKTFYPFSYTGFLKTKWRQRQTFERHNVSTASTFSRTKSSANDP